MTIQGAEYSFDKEESENSIGKNRISKRTNFVPFVDRRNITRLIVSQSISLHLLFPVFLLPSRHRKNYRAKL
jgi:hypothetical protein